MPDQITLEEALKLVDFEFVAGAWRVKHVKCDVWGDVTWDVFGTVRGTSVIEWSKLKPLGKTEAPN